MKFGLGTHSVPIVQRSLFLFSGLNNLWIPTIDVFRTISDEPKSTCTTSFHWFYFLILKSQWNANFLGFLLVFVYFDSKEQNCIVLKRLCLHNEKCQNVCRWQWQFSPLRNSLHTWELKVSNPTGSTFHIIFFLNYQWNYVCNDIVICNLCKLPFSIRFQLFHF